MSTFAKKVTSAVSALAIVFSILSPIAGVSAAYTSVDAANKLATLGVIVDQSANPADYRLGDTLTRAEGVKVMMNLSSTTVVDNCEGKFGDLTNADWACKYAETALANGMVAANASFSPSRLLSNIEGLKMVFQGRDLERNENADWRVGYVDAAVEMGIANAFTNYDTAVSRGQFFIWAANAIDADDVVVEDDLLCEILGTCEEPTDPTDPTDPIVVEGDMLEVSLSPMTPAAATIPQGISGLAVAKFDFTAGNSDVTVSSLTVKRGGLSDAGTLGDLAAFTSEGRASKGKGDTQNNDTEATLTLSNGGVVVMAGETVTFTIVADVNTGAGVTSDEFDVSIVEVVATSPVVMGSSVTGNLMRVGNVVAATVTVTADTTPSNVKAGEEGVNIAKFKIQGDNSRDVVLTSLTLKEIGTVDEEDELANFKLMFDGSVVATTAMANGKYVTFDLGAGVTIAEDQTEKFTVTADILGGSAKNIQLTFDKKLDLVGVDQQYGYGVSVATENVSLGTVGIDAGELTLVDMDAPSDKIRSDKQNVVLGTIKATNVSGGDLELQRFGVRVQIAGATGPADSFAEIFENFEVVVNGSTYDLTTTNVTVAATLDGVYEDTDLEIALPQGTTEFVIRADTKQNLTDAMTVDVSLATPTASGDGDGSFYVVETQDDTLVSDLTPSSLTFKKLTLIQAGATVARTPTASTTVVRGAKDVVALIFEVEADEASSIDLDEVKVTVESGPAAATNAQISQVKLYKGSVASGNLLDGVSGSNLAGGVATFEGFTGGPVNIAANAKQTFVVTIDVVDATGIAALDAYLYGVSMEDDDNDDIFLANDVNADGDIVDAGDTGIVTGKGLDAISNITVTDSGKLTINGDATNSDNSNPKTILGGTSAIIYSTDVIAENEEVDVEKITFTVDTDLTSAVTSATLYLDGVAIATNSNSDITATTITFKNLTGLIIPEANVELALGLNTATMGYQKVGAAINGANVTAVTVVNTDAEGVDSGKTLGGGDVTLNFVAGQAFSVVPAIVTVSVVDTLANGTAKVKFNINAGGNTASASNTAPNIVLTAATITNLGNGTLYQMYNEDNVGGAAADIASLTLADRTISANETYVIVPQTTTVGTTYTAKISKTAITYDVTGFVVAGLNANLTTELDLGTKTY